MKTKVLTTLSLLITTVIFLNAQNPDYRVEKIMNITQKGESYYDTLIQKFEYDRNGRLFKVTSDWIGHQKTEEKYTYSENKIAVTDNENYPIRSYETDSMNRVIKYQNGGAISTVIYDGSLISSVQWKLRYQGEDIIKTYKFGYNSEPKIFKAIYYNSNKPGTGEKPGDYDYHFFYNRDSTYKLSTLKRVDYGKASPASPFIWRYVVLWENNRIVSINKHLPDNSKIVYRSYKYDEAGNIIEEVLKKPSVMGKDYSTQYLVTYSKNKGNDYIIWQMSDWEYTVICNQRTYAMATFKIY